MKNAQLFLTLHVCSLAALNKGAELYSLQKTVPIHHNS